MTIVHRPAAVSQLIPEGVTESLVPVIVSTVGLAVIATLILMNVLTLPFTSVQKTQSVRTPMDLTTVSVIGATLKLKMQRAKVFGC